MALAHSSYARVAGIQSEVNKVTVTRVAGSEVQYQKQLNLHRKDMEIVVRNIRKEQKKLRRAMARYSRKLHEGRRNRAKREREERARDKNTVDNMQQVSDIFKLKFAEESEILPEETKPPDLEEATSGVQEEVGPDSNDNGDDKQEEATSEGRSETSGHCKDQGGEITLPPISAPAPSITNKNDDFEDEYGDERVREARTLPEISLDSQLESRLGSKRLPSIKPKKQEVSYSDIIKLQHSTNSKKLFNLVNILAQKHTEKACSKDQEHKGTRRRGWERLPPTKESPSLMTTYRNNIIGNESDVTTDRHTVNPPVSMVSRRRTHTQDTRRTTETSNHSATQEASQRASFLPVIPRQPLEESLEFRKRTQKRGPISWTEAIALIKSVHTL